MGITNFKTSSVKLTLSAISAVVLLHALTALALVMIETPTTSVILPPEMTPPVEIEFITLTVPMADVSEPKPKPKPEIVPVVSKTAASEPIKPTEPLKTSEPKSQKTQPKASQPQPMDEPKFADQKSESTVNSKTVIQAEATEPTEPTVAVTPVQTRIITATTPTPVENTSQQPDMAALQAAAQKAAQEKQAKAAQAVQAQAQEKAAQEKAQALLAAEARAKEQAAQKAAAQKAIDAKIAADNTPTNFTVTSTDWSRAPTFKLSQEIADRADIGQTFTLTLSLTIDVSGRITKASIQRSSGDVKVDREAIRQVKTGHFKPSTKQRVATLPIGYQVT